MSEMNTVFEVRETQLCAELGFSLDELRRRRVALLAQGVHWEYVKKRVLLTRVGALLLRATRDAGAEGLVEKGAPAGDCERNSATVEKGASPSERSPYQGMRPKIDFEGELVVWSVSALNRRLVVAHVPGVDPTNPLNLVAVMVRDNRNFLRGMKLPGPNRSLVRTAETVFDLQGACPRWRGRW